MELRMTTGLLEELGITGVKSFIGDLQSGGIHLIEPVVLFLEMLQFIVKTKDAGVLFGYSTFCVFLVHSMKEYTIRIGNSQVHTSGRFLLRRPRLSP